MNFLNFLSSGFNCKRWLSAVMGFHLTSQERIGSGIFRGGLPAVDTAKIPVEATSGKAVPEPSKADQVPTELKPTKDLLQPIIS